MADAETDFAEVWRSTLDSLDADGVPVGRRAFLTLAQLVGLLDSTALIAVPDDFSKEFVEQRLRMQLTQALSAQLGREVRIAVTVDPSLAGDEDETTLTLGEDDTWPGRPESESDDETPARRTDAVGPGLGPVDCFPDTPFRYRKSSGVRSAGEVGCCLRLEYQRPKKAALPSPKGSE